MPRTATRSTPRREAARGIRFVVLMAVLMTAVLVVGTLALERYLSRETVQTITAQVQDPSAPLAGGLADLEYVAMGDSYSAGPGLPDQVDLTCGRSSRSYPALLASRLQVSSFTDVTCSGARSLDITREQGRPGALVPPQIEAVTPTTDLVTLSIGGNDDNVFTALTSECPRLAETEPRGNPCQSALAPDGDATLQEQTDRIRSRVATILREIRERAPRAQVVVVGYPQIFPESGTCPALGFAGGDVPWARQVTDAIVLGLRAAADDVGVRFVDLRPASTGHDICSARPWMTGVDPAPSGVVPWHPVSRGMQGAADTIYAQLSGLP